MAYVTGTANTLAEVLTFIRNACTANGWTLAGNVLYRGNTYVEILLDGVVGVAIRGGTGIDGSNNLTTACADNAYLGTIAGIALAYPMTLEAHINTSPDEVFIVINHSVDYYSLMAWGISDVPGLTGSGVWFHATRTWRQGSREFQVEADGFATVNNFTAHVDGAPLFCIYAGYEASSSNGVNNSFIHADVDGLGWRAGASIDYPSTFRYVAPLLAYQPNEWNQETVLLPYPVYVSRTSGSKVSLVADLKHIRLARITYHEPGDIITLGPDKWKLYPWFRKNTAVPDGGSGLTHSGTFGYAVRYTGP